MTLKSYCKINLYLDVIRKRPDGYHDIETVFQAISLHDEIELIEIEKGFEFQCNIGEISNEDNIIWKAVNLLKPYINPGAKGLNIKLNKQIPMGAGLGGGSTNAATVLTGLNQYYNLNLTDEMLIEIGAKLGADVPFFIKGGLAKGEGIGEILTFYPAEYYNPIPLLVVYPNIHISTKEAYQGLIPGKLHPYSLNEIILGLKENNLSKIADNLYNTFEERQLKAHPEIQAIKNQLTDLGAVGALMSGSGSAIFGLFESNEMSKNAYESMNQKNWTLFLAETLPPFDDKS